MLCLPSRCTPFVPPGRLRWPRRRINFVWLGSGHPAGIPFFSCSYMVFLGFFREVLFVVAADFGCDVGEAGVANFDVVVIEYLF